MKIYIVTQESNVDGEILFNVVACKDLLTAVQVFADKIKNIFSESGHFGGYTKEEREEKFKIEEKGYQIFINDPYDDYYEYIQIEEKELIWKD